MSGTLKIPKYSFHILLMIYGGRAHELANLFTKNHMPGLVFIKYYSAPITCMNMVGPCNFSHSSVNRLSDTISVGQEETLISILNS